MFIIIMFMFLIIVQLLGGSVLSSIPPLVFRFAFASLQSGLASFVLGKAVAIALEYIHDYIYIHI